MNEISFSILIELILIIHDYLTIGDDLKRIIYYSHSTINSLCSNKYNIECNESHITLSIMNKEL